MYGRNNLIQWKDKNVYTYDDFVNLGKLMASEIVFNTKKVDDDVFNLFKEAKKGIEIDEDKIKDNKSLLSLDFDTTSQLELFIQTKKRKIIPRSSNQKKYFQLLNQKTWGLLVLLTTLAHLLPRLAGIQSLLVIWLHFLFWLMQGFLCPRKASVHLLQ